jgi:hypothetical protein
MDQALEKSDRAKGSLKQAKLIVPHKKSKCHLLLQEFKFSRILLIYSSMLFILKYQQIPRHELDINNVLTSKLIKCFDPCVPNSRTVRLRLRESAPCSSSSRLACGRGPQRRLSLLSLRLFDARDTSRSAPTKPIHSIQRVQWARGSGRRASSHNGAGTTLRRKLHNVHMCILHTRPLK